MKRIHVRTIYKKPFGYCNAAIATDNIGSFTDHPIGDSEWGTRIYVKVPDGHYIDTWDTFDAVEAKIREVEKATE